jgi:hypothetical protein
VVNTFVYEIGQQEDDLSKRVKIDALKLTDEEWVRVGLFCALLSVSYFSTSLW